MNEIFDKNFYEADEDESEKSEPIINISVKEGRNFDTNIIDRKGLKPKFNIHILIYLNKTPTTTIYQKPMNNWNRKNGNNLNENLMNTINLILKTL